MCGGCGECVEVQRVCGRCGECVEGVVSEWRCGEGVDDCDVMWCGGGECVDGKEQKCTLKGLVQSIRR